MHSVDKLCLGVIVLHNTFFGVLGSTVILPSSYLVSNPLSFFPPLFSSPFTILPWLLPSLQPITVSTFSFHFLLVPPSLFPTSPPSPSTFSDRLHSPPKPPVASLLPATTAWAPPLIRPSRLILTQCSCVAFPGLASLLPAAQHHTTTTHDTTPRTHGRKHNDMLINQRKHKIYTHSLPEVVRFMFRYKDWKCWWKMLFPPAARGSQQ